MRRMQTSQVMIGDGSDISSDAGEENTDDTAASETTVEETAGRIPGSADSRQQEIHPMLRVSIQ